jgi:putative ABC transport system substrate-binding protein
VWQPQHRFAHFRQAATYGDHIFKDEKPADLPIQAPTKYWLFINLKTAKTLGLTIPTILSVHRWAMENLGEF